MFDIIVVTYNAIQELKKCLRSVLKHTRHLPYVLTVVDNHSNDGTDKFLQELGSRIKVIRTSANKGFSYAANIGLKATRQEFVVLLDDDIEVESGWLEGLYCHMLGKENVGIVGGKIVYPDGRMFCADFSVKRFSRRGLGELDKGQRNYIKECDAITGPCFLMRRRIVSDVGYFDERFFPCQAEDIDYCLRVRLAGYKIIYDGTIRIIHHSLFRTFEQESNNVVRFHRKWEKILNKFPFSDSHPADKALEKGLDLWKGQQYGAALRYLRRAEALVKGLDGPYHLGVACLEVGNYKDAKRMFECGLKIYDPQQDFYRRSLFYLSLIYKKLGLSGRSRNLAQRLLEHVKL